MIASVYVNLSSLLSQFRSGMGCVRLGVVNCNHLQLHWLIVVHRTALFQSNLFISLSWYQMIVKAWK